MEGWEEGEVGVRRGMREGEDYTRSTPFPELFFSGPLPSPCVLSFQLGLPHTNSPPFPFLTSDGASTASTSIFPLSFPSPFSPLAPGHQPPPPPPLPSSPLNSPLNSHPTLISPYPPSSPFLYDLCSSSVPSFLLPYVFLNPSVPNHSVPEKDYPAVCPQDSDSPILENDLLPESHI